MIKRIALFFLLLLSSYFLFTSIVKEEGNAVTVDEYSIIKQSLNVVKPGFGVSDYGDFDVVDIPKAYAMVLSAELMKSKQSAGDYDLQMAANAGNWLLNNSDLNNDGVVGWGVPVAWDAFGDKSINSADTEYTIATAIVINSLLDWVELAPSLAPKRQILEIVKKAIQPYLKNNIFSSSGLYNYSLRIEDRKYNCFNAAIYMAGQMQRFTTFVSDTDLRNEIKVSVDRVMSAALKNKKIDGDGGWYWAYSMEENETPNDLAHAGYIIEGIMQYLSNKGTLSSLFDKTAILKHLDFFSNKDGSSWYFYPSFFGEKTISPRTYGLGMLLHTLSKYVLNKERERGLIKFISKYKHKGLFSRWQNEDKVVIEYLAYLMYGLASQEYENAGLNNIIFLHSDESHVKRVRNSLSVTEISKELPLTSLSKKGLDVHFLTDDLITAVDLGGGKKVVLDEYKSVPIKVLETQDKFIILLRELITNNLLLAEINKESGSHFIRKLDNQKDSFWGFREAIILGNKLVIVVYESMKSQNTLLSFSIDDKYKKETEVSLPSLEDPAGRTYEVIPKIFLLKGEAEKLYILGGRLFAVFESGVLSEKKVRSNLKVFVEAIINEKNEVFAIYKTKNASFNIINASNGSISYQGPKGEVVFGLDYYRQAVQYRTLTTNNDLKELFLHDFLNNKGAGTLYLGTNNIEGWSAWAQVYYLNGMLSFLELCEKDIEFYEVFEKYIKAVKSRLDLEVLLLLNQYESSDGLEVRTFSIDRSLATFAVQSSRFAMVIRRYLDIGPSKEIEKKYSTLKNNVLSLKNHMETLERGVSNVVSKSWNPSEEYYLRWPKGNKFYFDGLPVPYNHQNEWATFLLESSHKPKFIEIGSSVVELFVNHITNNGKSASLPKNAIWPYWWGLAWDGYGERDAISENKKSYVGDKGDGWISFRSIDAIAMISLFKKKQELRERYLKDIVGYTGKGEVYPFVSKALGAFNLRPLLGRNVVSEYIRFSTPWEFDNSVWSYLSFVKNNEGAGYSVKAL